MNTKRQEGRQLTQKPVDNLDPIRLSLFTNVLLPGFISGIQVEYC